MNSTLNTLAHTTPGQELKTGRKYSLQERLSGFISLIRPIFFILTPLNAASAAVLSSKGFPSPAQCFFGFITVAFASCAVNVFNDYIDRDRDKYIWPDRPLPSKLIRPNEALLVVIISLIISLTIAWLAFNPLTFLILLLAIALGLIYSVYLRKKVGYLSLPPIVGLIYLGGWAAFSPENMSNWLPWYLYALGVVWQAAHIMVYYPLHLIPGNEPETKAPPALFFTPSPQVAVRIGAVFTCLTLLLSWLLFFTAPLEPVYLALVVAVGIFALTRVVRLLKDVTSQEKGLKAFSSLSILRMVISAAILVSVFVAQF